MSCKDYELKLGAYVDGEVPSPERDEVEVHLSACQVCTRLAEDFRGIDELAAGSDVPAVSGEEWSRMFQEILRQGSEAPAEAAPEARDERVIPFSEIAAARSTSLRRRLLAVAAVAALVIFGLYLGSIILAPSGPDTGEIADPVSPTERVEKGGDYAEGPGGQDPEIQGEPEEEDEEIPPLDPPEQP